MTHAPYIFDTTVFSKEEQFNAFHHEISAMGLSSLPPTSNSGNGFAARFEGYEVGPLKIINGKTDAYSFGTRPRQIRGSAPDSWVLILRVAGYSDVDIAGNIVRFQGNGVELRSLDRPRQGYVSDNQSLFVCVPRQLLKGMEGVLDQLAMMDCSKCLHPLLSHYLRSMASMFPSLGIDEFDLIADTTMSMLQACITLSKDAIAMAQLPIMATRLEVAKNIIRSNLRSPELSAERLGAELNVSRRQLYKIFEAHGGVDRYLKSTRLNACYEAIITAGGRQAVNELAEEYGFVDAASFSRQFRTEFGCSPSDVREKVRSSPPVGGFERWLTGEQ